MENDTVIIVRCSPASVNTQAIFSISSFLILKSKIKDKQEWLKKEKTYFAYPYRIKSVWTEVSLTFTSIHNKYCVVPVEYTVSQDCTPTRWKAVCCFLHPWRRWVSHSITPDWWISTWGHTWCSTSVLCSVSHSSLIWCHISHISEILFDLLNRVIKHWLHWSSACFWQLNYIFCFRGTTETKAFVIMMHIAKECIIWVTLLQELQ